MNKKTKIELGKDDVAILVKPDGKSEIFVPYRNKGENELTPIQLTNILKEIRKLELAFTEIVNQSYEPETKEEKELFGEK